MLATLAFFGSIYLLFKHATIDRWWLWYAVIISLVVKLGYELRLTGVIVSIVVWKVISDVCRKE